MIAFAEHLSRPYVLVLLAGALRPSPLRSQLGEPVLSLPLAVDRTLLDAWLAMVANTAAPCAGVKIVVSSARDAEVMREAVHRQTAASVAPANASPDLEVIVDPSEWRGPAGLLYDIALGPRARISDDTAVVAAEGAVLPPRSLNPLLQWRADPRLAGAIGAGAEDRPAGVYAFSCETIRAIPAIGFHDIKEQLLPTLYRNGKRVPVVRIMDDVVRLRDLESYLHAVRLTLESETGIRSHHAPRSTAAIVSRAATISGSCVIQRGARIEDGAIIHDSVVMEGAQVGGGAVVARSIVGRSALVHARSVVRSAVVAHPDVPRPLPFAGRRRRRGARRIFRGSWSSESSVHYEGNA